MVDTDCNYNSINNKSANCHTTEQLARVYSKQHESLPAIDFTGVLIIRIPMKNQTPIENTAKAHTHVLVTSHVLYMLLW